MINTMFSLFFRQFLLHEDPQGLKEKVAKGRMRGQQCHIYNNVPLTLTLTLILTPSLRERGSATAPIR